MVNFIPLRSLSYTESRRSICCLVSCRYLEYFVGISSSILQHMWSRDALFALRPVAARLDSQVRSTVIRLLGPRRGRRASQHKRQRAARWNVTETTAVGEIPIITSTRRLSQKPPSFDAICRQTSNALRAVRRQPTSCVNVGAFNARSVSSNGTSQSISAWVTDLNLTAAGLVETWHDGSDIPRRLCAFWLRLHGASETKA